MTRADVDMAIAAMAADVVDHLNAAYPDSLAFVARTLGGARGDPDVAEAVGIDARGVVLQLVDTEPRTVRIDFAEPIEDAGQLGARLLGLAVLARQRSGEPGQTSAERELARRSSIRTFLTTVSAVETVHPHLRRITLAGGDLDTFQPLGPDTFLYVLLPPPGRSELTIDRDFTWEQVEEMAEDDQPVGAYYTVRAWRPDTAELDLLFVLHDPAGPASAWAERAGPGDPVALWGPRDSFEPSPDAGWYLLVADDTGLPALAVILESRPAGLPAWVVAEVRDGTEHQDLPDDPDIHVTWVHRDAAAPGTVPERTLEAVRSLRLPRGPGYVWGGGESHAMTAVRRYVRDELGHPRDRVSLVGYWRYGGGHDDDDEELDASTSR